MNNSHSIIHIKINVIIIILIQIKIRTSKVLKTQLGHSETYIASH